MGADFLPGEVVTVELMEALPGGGNMQLATTVASPQGTFSTAGKITADSQLGIFTLKAFGSLGTAVTTPFVVANQKK